MPRCSVCEHPRRDEIDAALALGRSSVRKLADTYGVKKSAISRHRKAHLQEAPMSDAEPAFPASSPLYRHRTRPARDPGVTPETPSVTPAGPRPVTGNALPMPLRVRLLQGQGYSRDEIAARLGVTPTTVSDYLTDARAAAVVALRAGERFDEWAEHMRRAEDRRALILIAHERAMRRGNEKAELAALRLLEEHDRKQWDDYILTAGSLRPPPPAPTGGISDPAQFVKELAAEFAGFGPGDFMKELSAEFAQLGPISLKEVDDLLKQHGVDLDAPDPSCDTVN